LVSYLDESLGHTEVCYLLIQEFEYQKAICLQQVFSGDSVTIQCLIDPFLDWFYGNVSIKDIRGPLLLFYVYAILETGYLVNFLLRRVVTRVLDECCYRVLRLGESAVSSFTIERELSSWRSVHL